MTLPEFVQRVKRRLNALGVDPRVAGENELEIVTALASAGHSLAHKVMNNDGRRSLLQQIYSVTLNGAGEGNLQAATGGITTLAGEILLEGVMIGSVHDNDGNRLVGVPHYYDFIAPRTKVFPEYCLKANIIATCAAGTFVTVPADIQSVNGPLSVLASYVPSLITGWPNEILDDLESEVVAVMITKAPIPNNAGS